MKRFAGLLLGLAAIAIVASGAIVYTQAPKEPGVVILKGAPMGGVKFDHPKHSKTAAGKCETCHHASKTEMPAKAAQQKCSDCHTKVATAPMKTKYQAAFHDPMAKKGTCVDCHVKATAAGKKAPAKCADCHKKENV
jgi:hypothetical protein